MTTLERKITFRPAFDKRNTDPKKNYGIHCMDIVLSVSGEAGTVSLVVFSGMYLPHVMEELEIRRSDYNIFRWIGADLGYHWKTKRSEYEYTNEHCEFTGGVCHYSGSSLAAEELAILLVSEGENAVFEALTQRYNENL